MRLTSAAGLILSASLLFSLKAAATQSRIPTIDEQDVIYIPLTKEFPHDQSQSGHPNLQGWSEAQIWGPQIKNPVNALDNYIYTMDCMLGTPNTTEPVNNIFKCVFDSTTSVSSTFASNMADYAIWFWNPEDSSSVVPSGRNETFMTLGLNFTGEVMTDKFCLGYGDVHTTVCIEQQDFVYIEQQNDASAAQWKPIFRDYANVNTIVGLGKTSGDVDGILGFVDNAFQSGYLINGIYSFQGQIEGDEYAHLTIGGYRKNDLDSYIDWFDVSNFTEWKLYIDEFVYGDLNLLEPPSDKDVYDHGLSSQNHTESMDFYAYGHFNSGYPFLGVDQYVGEMIKAQLQEARPDVSCREQPTYNPWNVCYYMDVCDDSVFEGQSLDFQFNSGTNYTIPLSALMINYTVYSSNVCALAVQIIDNMPYNLTAERHFYLGDIFFKQYVGVFNPVDSLMGVAKSSRSVPGVVLDCESEEACATPTLQPLDPSPDPGPEPPVPTPPVGGKNLLWLWILLGVLALITIVLLAIFFYRRSKKNQVGEVMVPLKQDDDMVDTLESEDFEGKFKSSAHMDLLVKEQLQRPKPIVSQQLIEPEEVDDARIEEQDQVKDLPTVSSQGNQSESRLVSSEASSARITNPDGHGLQ